MQKEITMCWGFVFVVLWLSTTSAFADEFVCKLPNGKKMIQDFPCPTGTTTTYANTAPPESPERTAQRNQMRQRISDEGLAESRRKSAALLSQLQAEERERKEREYQQQRAQELQLRQQYAEQQEARLRLLERQAAQQAQQQQDYRPPPPRTLNCFTYGPGQTVCN